MVSCLRRARARSGVCVREATARRGGGWGGFSGCGGGAGRGGRR